MKKFESVRQDCSLVLKNRAELLAPLKGQMLVVTGGTGFVGTWLAELVTCLNDEYKFRTQLVLIARGTDHFRDTRPHLAKRADIRLVKNDVRSLLDLPKESDWIVHAAANPDNRTHATSPIETMLTISEGTSALLRAADRCDNLKMFLNVSSGLIYGSLPVEMGAVAESFSGAPLVGSTSSAYAEAKRYAETFVSATRTQTQIPCVNVRPFAFIGPYQSLETPWALNNFLHDALGGSAIRVFGDGRAVRSYLYGSDMAFWLLRMLTASKSGECFNLGSPETVTLEKLAFIVADFIKPSPEVVLRSQSAHASANSFVPDVSLASKKLQLSVTVPLKVALEKTLQWNRA